jgi:anti-sigma factor RsiW
MSDRIDGALVPPGPARLSAHLRNCDRCVEHERALAHARENLVREFIASHPHADVPERQPGPRGAAGLRIVPSVVTSQPLRVVPSFGGASPEPGDRELPLVSFAGPGGQVAFVAPEPIAGELVPDEEPDVLADEIAPAEPADATPSERSVEHPDVDESEDSEPTALIWNVALGAAVLLSLGALIVTLLAIAGVQRIF